MSKADFQRVLARISSAGATAEQAVDLASASRSALAGHRLTPREETALFEAARAQLQAIAAAGERARALLAERAAPAKTEASAAADLLRAAAKSPPITRPARRARKAAKALKKTPVTGPFEIDLQHGELRRTNVSACPDIEPFGDHDVHMTRMNTVVRARPNIDIFGTGSGGEGFTSSQKGGRGGRGPSG